MNATTGTINKPLRHAFRFRIIELERPIEACVPLVREMPLYSIVFCDDFRHSAVKVNRQTLAVTGYSLPGSSAASGLVIYNSAGKYRCYYRTAITLSRSYTRSGVTRR